MLAKTLLIGWYEWPPRIEGKQQGSKHINRASNKPKITLNRALSHMAVDGLCMGGNNQVETRSQKYDSYIQRRVKKRIRPL